MRKILVGADGSPASLGALSIAAGLAHLGGGSLAVAFAAGADGPGGEEDHRARVEAWCEAARVPPGAYEALVLAGEPGAALVAAAAQPGIGLVVVGTEGTLGRSHPRFGSVANLLAHRVDVPFLTVPVGCRWRGLHEVAIGVDDSEGSHAAIDALAALPGIEHASVTAVHASQPLSGWAAEPLPPSLQQRAAHDLQTWAQPLERSAAALRREVREEGQPALVLLAVADEVHADLVVAGAQATNRVTGTRAGSTAFEILHRATRPTMLVPPPPAVPRSAG